MPLHLAKILPHFRLSRCRVHHLFPITMTDPRIPTPPRPNFVGDTSPRAARGFHHRDSEHCPREPKMSRSNSNLIVPRRLGAPTFFCSNPGPAGCSLSHLAADIAFKPVLITVL